MTWKFELLFKLPGDSMKHVLEGPAWDGEHLYFTHIHGRRILRYDPKSGVVGLWREGINRPNGLAFDGQGRLFGCCAGGRSIVRYDPDGRNNVIVDRVEGKRLNVPNDLAIDRLGRIWFTNPWNKGNVDATERMELDHQSVLRADPKVDGSYAVTRVTFDTTMPNGILVSQDQKTLYIAESGYAKSIMRELRSYPISEDGTLGTYTTLCTWGEDARGVHRGVDGMCLDADGNIIAVTGWEVSGFGPLIYVFSPTGRVLETHTIPGANHHHPNNCCFGGPDMSTFFLTIQGHLFQAHTDRVGWAIYP